MTRDKLFDWLHEQFELPVVEEIMEQVDEYAATLTEEPPEVWTAEQVADFLGCKDGSTAAARTMMSRWGIKSIAVTFHPRTGRHKALYPADQVRAEHEKRRAPCKTPTSS